MKRWSLALWAALVLVSAGPVSAQRRVAPPPPAELRVTPIGGHRVALIVEAREAIELVADRRLLHVEIRDARNRRASCAPMARARSESRARTLAAGERWAEWLDLREVCWGRALAALEGAREVTFHFDAGRARGAWVARTPTTSFRALTPVVSTFRPPPRSEPPASRLGISLAPADGLRGGHPTFRIRITGPSQSVRAFVRPEHVSFPVITPTGGRIECALAPFDGRALPDFFTRLGGSRAVAFALDAVAYCGRFEEPGVYEITPVVTLRDDGAEWRLDAVTGTFVGVPAPLRIRSTTYVEQPYEDAR